MKAALAAAMVLACAGCAVVPAPAWETDTQDALDGFISAYLAGNLRESDRHFRDARHAVSGTGRADLVARVELIRCAIGTAALDADACTASQVAEPDLTEGDRAYAAFLAGRIDPAQAAELPAQYRPVAQARDADARIKALADIKDPVSRLIAAGALFRAGNLSPEGVAAAVDTASEQAWRNPLLAYLKVQMELAEASADTTMRDTLRKRIELVSPR
jgi:hypothetical protein